MNSSEKIKNYKHEWYIKNKDKQKSKQEIRRKENKDAFNAQRRDYYSRTKDKQRENRQKKLLKKKTLIPVRHSIHERCRMFQRAKTDYIFNGYKVSLRQRLYLKVNNFRRGKQKMFTTDEFIAKFNESPFCYITGRPIDINDTKNWNLDHIVPVSRGGDNSLENCGITCREANAAKNNMNYKEFVLFCQEVINHYNTHIGELDPPRPTH